MLEALRPKTSINLKELTLLTKSEVHRLYPSALEESVLLCFARDLRLIESLSFDHEQLDAPLAPSLYVILELLMRPGNPFNSSDGFEMSETGLARAIKVLQSAVEREVVSRIVGVNSGIDEDEFFIKQLDLSQCIEDADT